VAKRLGDPDAFCLKLPHSLLTSREWALLGRLTSPRKPLNQRQQDALVRLQVKLAAQPALDAYHDSKGRSV